MICAALLIALALTVAMPVALAFNFDQNAEMFMNFYASGDLRCDDSLEPLVYAGVLIVKGAGKITSNFSSWFFGRTEVLQAFSSPKAIPIRIWLR